MQFYNALQLDASVLKAKMRASETKKEKHFYLTAMVLRSVLTVLFSIVFISGLSSAFGPESTPMAVALFCIMLGIRFVNFEYCIGDSLITLAASFLILLLVPCAVTMVPPIVMLLIHFVAFFALLYMTCQRPELGNGGLYSFAYVYLVGNPVNGQQLVNRAMLTLVGYIICATILFIKHRSVHKGVRFHHVIKKFDLSNIVYLWQLRMAIGVSCILTLGSWLKVERFMWMGFACASMLSSYPYTGDVKNRVWQRLVGVLVGSAAFFAVYQILPESVHGIMGPMGGLCLGLCTDYRYKTATNCFGALMIAVSIYGLHGAIILRIWDTVLGILFGLLVAEVFHRVFMKNVEVKEQ